MSVVPPRKRFTLPHAPTLEPAAPGVWLMRGGVPLKTMNVYLIEDEGGVTLFDAGIEEMTEWIGEVADRMGGLKRVVLGHSHADHRGAAPGLGAPVYCHPDEVSDAESDGGAHYFDISKLEQAPARFLFPRMLPRWDGGPVKVAGTLAEGDQVAGFEVVHLPGHAPGLIGLWRASDRLMLGGDVIYTLDPQTTRFRNPGLPHPAFNWSTDGARQSARKLAELEPSIVWLGHANPIVGAVRDELLRVAEAA